MRPVPRQTLQRSPVAVLVPVPLQPGQPRVAGLVCLPNVHHLPRRLILGAERAARPGVRRTGDGGGPSVRKGWARDDRDPYPEHTEREGNGQIAAHGDPPPVRPVTAPMALTTPVRPYDWGSVTALPELLGTEPTGRPQAELWAGAHPAAPSSAGGTPLNVLIDADPETMLGRPSVERFGPALPYLLKILAVEKPLSLQVHPTMAQARSGFAAEEERGVPVDHFTRSYKDPYHKPEMVCALTDFHGLCGFRDPADTAALLEDIGVPELRPWIKTLRNEPPSQALRTVLEEMLDESSRPIQAAVEPALTSVYAEIARAHPGDPGVLAALLLNHVELKPGQALFLEAGVPHSYLGGLAIEVMANSDNVLRCGLTGKHVDVPELMRVVNFVPSVPCRVEPAAGFRYCPDADEFSLIRHDLADDPEDLPSGLPQTLLCLEGEAHLTTDRTLTLSRGQAAFIPAAAPAARLTGRGVLYRVAPAIP